MSNSTYHRIAVAIDDSSVAQAALTIALSIIAPDGELALVHAIDRAMIIAEVATPYGADASPALEAFDSDEVRLFAVTTACATEHHLRSTSHALDGRSNTVIADFIAKGAFDAVVMGTRAHHGIVRLVLGSTAESVLRASPVPVFVTSEHTVSRIASGIGHILVAVDNSEPSVAAVSRAIGLAQRFGSRITFAHVTENDPVSESHANTALAAAYDHASAAGIGCETTILAGRPAEAIVHATQTAPIDLIIIGTHGRTGFAHLRLGSVAEAVIRNATSPVMVVPSGAPLLATSSPATRMSAAR
jgi:nucleotide-binding universal stress UspA family protein